MRNEEIKIEYKEPKVDLQIQPDFRDLSGLIPTTSSAPTWTPRKFSEQIVIYTSGSTYRLYWWDTTGGAWRYASGT